jgi:hypothetical protein
MQICRFGLDSRTLLKWMLLQEILGSTRSRVCVTLQLAVYRQSVRLAHKPLETHDQHSF